MYLNYKGQKVLVTWYLYSYLYSCPVYSYSYSHRVYLYSYQVYLKHLCKNPYPNIACRITCEHRSGFYCQRNVPFKFTRIESWITKFEEMLEIDHRYSSKP